MELDARDYSEFRVGGLIIELARYSNLRLNTCAYSVYTTAKHLEIILKDINDFVRLQLALNSWSHSINEGIKSFTKFGVILKGLCRLSNEILSIVRTCCIDHSIVVCLCLQVYHAISGL